MFTSPTCFLDSVILSLWFAYVNRLSYILCVLKTFCYNSTIFIVCFCAFLHSVFVFSLDYHIFELVFYKTSLIFIVTVCYIHFKYIPHFWMTDYDVILSAWRDAKHFGGIIGVSFYAIKKQVSFSIPADYLLYYVQRIFTMHSLSGCSTFHQRNRKYCLGWN